MAAFRNSPAIHHRSLVLNPSSQVTQETQISAAFLLSFVFFYEERKKKLNFTLHLFVWWNIIDCYRAPSSTLALGEARALSSELSKRLRQRQHRPHTVE